KRDQGQGTVDHGPEETISPKIFSVGELTRQIRSLLETSYAEVWITGEISNFKAHTNGHFYFTLKDDKSQINAVMFRGSNSRLAFKPEDGMEALCHGKVTVYEVRGQYQIVVDHIEPKGIGALQMAFEQLKKKLGKEGLFDAARKRTLPFLPKKIGVVTSPTGAAIRDILNILRRRFPEAGVLLVPVKVQGDGAKEEIAEAIRLLNQQGDVDVMIVGRGGGSIEDLWAFNEEVVARAIFASNIPVISAVGHEVDFTIADFTADMRAPTPSAAAELVIPRKQDLEASLQNMRERLNQAVSKDFPQWMMRVDQLTEGLGRGLQVGLEKRGDYLKRLMSNLDHLSPLHILGKGYSLVQKVGSAMPVKKASALKKGDDLQITFSEGKCLAKVV
ncbi:MAG: exodeoxyribonuclease VII large subunit, partial [bacterium]|nr:exodeoxyribonuclease VII large subunit [bacterium]